MNDEEKFGAVVEHLPAFIVVVRTEDNSILYCNETARGVFGEDATGKACGDFLSEAMNAKIFTHVEVFDERIGGKWYHISNTSIDYPAGCKSRLVMGFDVSDLKTVDGRTPVIVTIDSLTGIPSRQTGLDYFNYYLEKARAEGFVFTVCYIDINDLKYVNDNFGHAAGDEYIKAVVSCVKSSTRHTDIFSRMGGDEFLLVFPNCRHEIVENIMGIVCNKLEFINESEGKCYSIAYGLMEVNTETNFDADYILNAVDSKMYYMKNEYKLNRKPLP